jgi:dCTP deaminase
MTVLSMQTIEELSLGRLPIIKGIGMSEKDILTQYLQPASLDCPIVPKVWRMMAAAVPQPGETMTSLLPSFSPYDFDLREGKGGFLDRGHTYLMRIGLDMALPPDIRAEFSPKSTTGRNDFFVRAFPDSSKEDALYDLVPSGYHGALWLEATPLSFSHTIIPESVLTQVRFKSPGPGLSDEEIRRLHSQEGIIFDGDGNPIPHDKMVVRDGSVHLHLELEDGVAGLVASPTNPIGPIRLDKAGLYNPREYWTPLRRLPNERASILRPGEFYLLRTKERVRIPRSICGTVTAYDVGMGEFRSHYAGFFDNGFGGETGTPAVLEVRVRDVAKRVVDGRVICRLTFEKTDLIPRQCYGDGQAGTYRGGKPSMGKNFTDRTEAWEESYWK